MTPGDLMVGDLVMLFDETPARVDAIGNTEVYVYEKERGDWHVGYEHIKPIPLTDEILQKNGFDCSDPEVKQYHFTEGKERYHFSLRQMYNKKNEKDGYAFYAFNVLSLIINVSDLQHALRLCGIDKEITI